MSTDLSLQSCLSCNERLPRSRGLCLACYGRCGRAVRAGQTSGGRLEAEGRARPAAPAGRAWRRGFRLGPLG